MMTTYKLNSEVTTATPSLLQAAQIGELSYENPTLQHLENKDAILVMSFGTTFKGTRKATIQATVDQIQALHPNTKISLAFTSHIVIDRVKEHEGLRVPIPEEALDQLKEEGYTRIALTALDTLPGIEYAYTTAVFNRYKNNFKKMTIGTPMLYWMGQEDQRDDVADFVEALKTGFTYEGASTGYVSSITNTTTGKTLAHFDNGPNSGPVHGSRYTASVQCILCNHPAASERRRTQKCLRLYGRRLAHTVGYHPTDQGKRRQKRNTYARYDGSR